MLTSETHSREMFPDDIPCKGAASSRGIIRHSIFVNGHSSVAVEDAITA
jgi:hypothetical protein